MIVVYNDSVTLSAETTIYNLTSDYSFELDQTTVGEDIIIQI
nr:MAG TPA: hypothetical protein [Caudoviricetes sp.]